MANQVIKITSKEAGQRLDVTLAELTKQTRSFWATQIKKGIVLVAGRVAKASYLVAPSDIISVNLPPDTSESFAAPALPIVYEDADIVVVDKPAGLLTHPTAHSHEATLADFAAARSSDTDLLRPGIVHRLDRDTSGLIIIAKTTPAKTYLQQQFKAHQIRKTYVALVYGRLRPEKAIIRLPIGTSNQLKKTVTLSGKEATTAYTVVAEYPGFSLVEASPATGRTHQLRLHFTHLGHPIAGDVLYGSKTRPRGLSRQFLHAVELEFFAPSGHKLHLKSPLPPELSQYLKSLTL